MTQAPATANPGSAPVSAAPGIAAAATAQAKKPESSGIWNLAADAFVLAEKMSSIDGLIQQTATLAAQAKQLRAPYVTQMKALSSRGDALGKQAGATDSSAPQDARAQFDDLADQFKRLAAAVIPLSKQAVLLELYSRDLSNWREVVRFELRADLKSLAVRLGSLILILAIVIAAAELWRRAVYPVSYTHLDVYKRQGIAHLSGKARIGRKNQGCNALHDEYFHLHVRAAPIRGMGRQRFSKLVCAGLRDGKHLLIERQPLPPETRLGDKIIGVHRISRIGNELIQIRVPVYSVE